MTTGRINQVTTFRPRFSRPSYTPACHKVAFAFTMWSSSTFPIQIHRDLRMPFPPRGTRPSLRLTDGPPCPVLTCFKQDPPLSNKGTRVTPFNEDYHQMTGKCPKDLTQSWRILKCFCICIRTDHRQAIHCPSTLPKLFITQG